MLHTETIRATAERLEQHVLLNGWSLGRLTIVRGPLVREPRVYEYSVHYVTGGPDEPKVTLKGVVVHAYADGAPALLASAYALVARLQRDAGVGPDGS